MYTTQAFRANAGIARCVRSTLILSNSARANADMVAGGHDGAGGGGGGGGGGDVGVGSASAAGGATGASSGAETCRGAAVGSWGTGVGGSGGSGVDVSTGVAVDVAVGGRAYRAIASFAPPPDSAFRPNLASEAPKPSFAACPLARAAGCDGFVSSSAVPVPSPRLVAVVGEGSPPHCACTRKAVENASSATPPARNAARSEPYRHVRVISDRIRPNRCDKGLITLPGGQWDREIPYGADQGNIGVIAPIFKGARIAGGSSGLSLARKHA